MKRASASHETLCICSLGLLVTEEDLFLQSLSSLACSAPDHPVESVVTHCKAALCGLLRGVGVFQSNWAPYFAS